MIGIVVVTAFAFFSGAFRNRDITHELRDCLICGICWPLIAALCCLPGDED